VPTGGRERADNRRIGRAICIGSVSNLSFSTSSCVLFPGLHGGIVRLHLSEDWRRTMSTAPAPVIAQSTEPARVIPRKAVVSWIIYDLANVIFSMGVTSLNFSLFVRSVVGSERADSLVGRISAVSMGIMFCISPLLGAMTDRARRRMPFLMWATIICCA